MEWSGLHFRAQVSVSRSSHRPCHSSVTFCLAAKTLHFADCHPFHGQVIPVGAKSVLPRFSPSPLENQIITSGRQIALEVGGSAHLRVHSSLEVGVGDTPWGRPGPRRCTGGTAGADADPRGRRARSTRGPCRGTGLSLVRPLPVPPCIRGASPQLTLQPACSQAGSGMACWGARLRWCFVQARCLPCCTYACARACG